MRKIPNIAKITKFSLKKNEIGKRKKNNKKARKTRKTRKTT